MKKNQALEHICKHLSLFAVCTDTHAIDTKYQGYNMENWNMSGGVTVKMPNSEEIRQDGQALLHENG